MVSVSSINMHLERVWAWGEASSSVARVARPSTVQQLQQLLKHARRDGRTIGFRGGGNSYGDAFSNREQIVLDLTRMNRILEWDPKAGIIRVEPGVTIDQLWRYVLADGWWPPIVTGTAKTTVGGCAAMNTHGKNSWKMGVFGDHVVEFDFMTADGERMTACPDTNPALFFGAIGGFGMLGCFVSLTLRLKRVYSGWLDVTGATQPDLGSAMSFIEARRDEADYLVGWLDAAASGRRLGRAEMHSASYLPAGSDPLADQTLQLKHQQITDAIFGVFPKSSMWRLMRPFINVPGLRLVNSGKYAAARIQSGPKGKSYRQTHIAYHFLLDYLPNWKRAYGRGGLIQYQPFLPIEHAEEGFAELLQLCRRRGLPNFLTVLKRHKPDQYLISYGLDGYSLAMDFPVTGRNRPKMAALAKEMDEIVLRHGGRFYLAKDSTLWPETARGYLGDTVLKTFFALKEQYDPQEMFQTDLWRRVFAPLKS